MKKNMGNADRIIRVIIAVAIMGLYSQDIIAGTVGYVLLAIAGILVVTSIVAVCPLYSVFGIKTCVRPGK